MRIFDVNVSREMYVQIAAESETELEEALLSADFDDWSPPGWDWTVQDTLKRVKTDNDLERYPDRPDLPDIWVGSGKCLSLSDYDGDLMAAIEQTILEHKRKVYQALHQMTLPGID